MAGDPVTARPRDYVWLLLPSVAGWVVLSLLITPGLYLGMHAASRTAPAAFGHALIASLPWAVVAWLVLVYNRWRCQRGDLGKAGLGLQLALGVCLMLVLVSLAWQWRFPVLGLESVPRQPAYTAMLLEAWPRGLAIYAAIWCVCNFGILWRDRARIKARLVSAELRRLRTQLNPHFLFNTLNAIAELGYTHPEAADRTITQLSGLLRKSLDEVHQQEIALRDELDFLRHYLDIQQTLLRGRLHIEFEIADNTLNARVPGMILQPLVENAVTHGIGRSGTGYIVLRSRRQGETLVIEVEDNGWGLMISAPRGGREGIGIGNTRARLGFLYGDLAGLELESRPGEGLTARLQVPFHEAYAFDENSHAGR